MTTTVTIETHDWPVQAHRINPKTGEDIVGPERVEPHSKFVFHLHDTLGLRVIELEKPND
jgi:hypothetical protein